MSNTESHFPTTKPPPLFEAFTKEVERIHARWLVWHRLFADIDAPHRNSVFSEWSAVWSHIYCALMNDVILSLCRLTDRQEMRGRPNLTVDRIWDEMKDFGGRENLRKAARGVKHNFLESVKSAQLVRMRHRWLGHNDMATQLQEESHSADIEFVRKAVAFLVEFHWRCESFHEGRLVDYYEGPSAVCRDYTFDRKVHTEVDALVAQLSRSS